MEPPAARRTPARGAHHPRWLGYAPAGPGNAIALADTPVWDCSVGELSRTCCWRRAARRWVCPPGVMGNSEVGHLTLGSGRIIYQDLSRINRAIADGSFFDNACCWRLSWTG